ncbi:MAG: hypothetical protein ACOCXA_06610 [Planctomycetota bacterium]
MNAFLLPTPHRWLCLLLLCTCPTLLVAETGTPAAQQAIATALMAKANTGEHRLDETGNVIALGLTQKGNDAAARSRSFHNG